MTTAISKDINKEYLEAVNYYESEIINQEIVSVKSFANLAFLYWAFAYQQIEFNDVYNIPDEWSTIGGESFLKVIGKGLEKYPESLELNFWKNYFPYRMFMTEFSEKDCINLLTHYGEDESLIPYFFLHLFNKELYKDKVTLLLANCKAEPTAKNNYIQSFINNF
jgi:hypothetical protein